MAPIVPSVFFRFPALRRRIIKLMHLLSQVLPKIIGLSDQSVLVRLRDHLESKLPYRLFTGLLMPNFSHLDIKVLYCLRRPDRRDE